MKKIYCFSVTIVFVFLMFNRSVRAQNYELLWARFSSGGGGQKGTNYEAKLSIGSIIRSDVKSANFDIQTIFTPPDSLPPVPFSGGVSMVSIPLSVENKDAASLLGNGFTDSARWAPDEKAYHLYSKDPNDALLQISPGHGYWLKLDSSKTVTVYGTLVSSSSDYSVSLKAGWNQIGNPFTANVNLSNVKVKYQGTTKSLSEAADAGWVGMFALAYPDSTTGYQVIHPSLGTKHALEPWLGYWFNSTYDLDLIIPYPGTAKSKEDVVAGDAGGFSVIIKIDTVNSTKNIVVGRSKRYELIPKPPEPLAEQTEQTQVYLTKGSGEYLAEFNESLTYEFVVMARQNENVAISVDKNNLPQAYSIYLTNAQSNQEVNLGKADYTYTADGTEKRFKVQISKADKELFTQNLNLDSVVLYPNPVRNNVNLGQNGTVNIEGKFSSGLPVNAEIEFYTMTGKLVKREPLPVGYGGKGKVKLSTQSGDTTLLQLPNGVYLVRVTFYNALGEKVSKIVKMVIVK